LRTVATASSFVTKRVFPSRWISVMKTSLHVSFEVPVVSDAIDHAFPEQLILPGVPRLDESTVLLFAVEPPKWGPRTERRLLPVALRASVGAVLRKRPQIRLRPQS